MDAPTHKAIGIWCARHSAIADFLRQPDCIVSAAAVEPDVTFKDNIKEFAKGEGHYHSCKHDTHGNLLEGGGGAPSMLSSLGILAFNARQKMDWALARESLMLASHYAVDNCTPPHTTQLKPEIHMPFEQSINVHVDRVLAGLAYKPLPLLATIGGSARAVAREVWAEVGGLYEKLKTGKEISDMPDEAAHILGRCALFSLAVQLEILKRTIGG